MRRVTPAAVHPGPDQARTISIELEGKPIAAREGEPVAAALLANDETIFSRSIKYHRARGPWCMSGECSHCLMRVDGVPNVFTCKTACKPGMKLERQNAYPSAKVDVFAAIDFMFPRGLDHHEMFAGVPVADQVMAKVARHLAGLGLLPDKATPVGPAAIERRVKVAIVGGGAAGLAAAEVLTEKGVAFELFEREAMLGGRRTFGPDFDQTTVPALPSARTGATAIGLYEDEDGRFLAVVEAPGGRAQLSKIYAEKFLLAMGGFAALTPFENNDHPGVYSGPAAARLIRQHGVVPGERPVIVGEGPELAAYARLFELVGAKPVAVVDRHGGTGSGEVRFLAGEPKKAHRRGGGVSALTVTLKAGGTEKLSCDCIVVVGPPSPSFALARQGGAEVAFSAAHQGFVVQADASGRTAAKDLFVAGDLTGAKTITEAIASGRRAGEAVAEERS